MTSDYTLELLFSDGEPGFYVVRVESKPQLWEFLASVQREGIIVTAIEPLASPTQEENKSTP